MKDVLLGVKDVLLGEKELLLGVKEVLLGVKEVLLGVKEVLLGVKDVLLGVKDVLLGEKEVLLGEKELLLGEKELPRVEDVALAEEVPDAPRPSWRYGIRTESAARVGYARDDEELRPVLLLRARARSARRALDAARRARAARRQHALQRAAPGHPAHLADHALGAAARAASRRGWSHGHAAMTAPTYRADRAQAGSSPAWFASSARGDSGGSRATLPRDELDAESLLWDVQRRVRTAALPARPVVVARIEL